MFDESLVDMFRKQAHQAFVQHGDVLRSIVVIFDYHGELNRAKVQRGIWLGPEGPVTTPEGMAGSIDGLMLMHLQAFERLRKFNQHISQETGALLQQLQETVDGQEEDQAKQEAGRPGDVSPNAGEPVDGVRGPGGKPGD